MTTSPFEAMATRILEAALRERRAAELLECLFEGGSATVNAVTGKLVLASAAQLRQMVVSDDLVREVIDAGIAQEDADAERRALAEGDMQR